jgi:hypothetical protein
MYLAEVIMCNKAFSRLIVVFHFIGVLVLAACDQTDSSQSTIAQNGTPTIPVPTPTLCPIPTPYAFELPVSKPNKLLLILVDKSGSYEHSTKKVLEQLQRVLPEIVEPGDSVIVNWIGSKSGSPSEEIVSAKVRKIAQPTLEEQPATPTPISAPTSIPMPALEPTKNTTIGRNSENRKATSIALLNNQAQLIYQQSLEKQINFYNCTYETWLNNQEQLINQWNEAKNRSIEEFKNKISSQLDIAANNIESDNQTLITSALQLTSKQFQTARDNNEYQQYKLVIFSDMEQIGQRDISTNLVELKEVSVLIAGLYCENPQVCHRNQDIWRNFFIEAQANSIDFLWTQESDDEALLKHMR